MRYHLNQDLDDKKGIISNLHCFFNRHLDTGFKTKWDGLWIPPYKFLDYYAVKINGEWLGPETVEAVDYGEKMVFHHETDSIKVKETVEASPTTPGIDIELQYENKMDKKKAVHTGLELGVDIRHKDTDTDNTDYTMEKGPNRLSVERKSKKLMISSSEEFNVNGDSYEKEHFPGERQKCFIPGEISFRSELEDRNSISIEVSTPDGVFGRIDSQNQELEHEKLGHGFSSALDSLRNLCYDRDGTGIIAGHPWFQSFWARDSFWSVLGLIDAGYFELAEDILTNFADRGLPDKIVIDGEDRVEPKQYDTEPLFIMAADKLERHHRTNDVIDEAVAEAAEDLKIENDGIVHNEACGTWMDTIRRKNAVDVQSLWIEALDALNDDRREKLFEGLENFTEEEYMKDSINGEDTLSINPALALMYGHIDEGKAQKYLETINGEFASRYGARTRSCTDPGYEASGYHTGSVWGLTTCWAAAANIRYGRERQGVNFIEKFLQFLDTDQPGAFPENVDAENGKILGCSEQAWSAGLIVHVIDTYLLGIKVRKNRVEIQPPENISCTRRNKRIKDEEVDIRFEDGDAEILDETELDIVVKNE
ncbi:amylo-alpha-1,6-glucosidase [Candidatus Nanosalina sp. VS9-1]|uniref:amylo-alpha-1,6-glucosidase n=1 Tax=Candidatus Nanosalina sp. VS9-1 TaxID=3388566 RepID=UPI0039E09AD1